MYMRVTCIRYVTILLNYQYGILWTEVLYIRSVLPLSWVLQLFD